VNRIRGHVESIADPVCVRLAGHANPHLAFQNDVRRFYSMRMIGISRVRPVFPHVCMRKTLALQLSDIFLLIHGKSVARRAVCANVFGDDNALPAEMGVAAERARRLQERRSLYLKFTVEVQ
jgi:hypothetical protein